VVFGVPTVSDPPFLSGKMRTTREKGQKRVKKGQKTTFFGYPSFGPPLGHLSFLWLFRPIDLAKPEKGVKKRVKKGQKRVFFDPFWGTPFFGPCGFCGFFAL